LPPFEANVTTVYIRVCTPPPHATGHLPHAPQLPSQST
jgi:hypothetical protein